MQDNTTSYSDIARMFGVSLKQVKKHGSRDEWVDGRQEVTENVEFAIKEKTVDQRVEINEKHRKQYASIQSIVQTYLYIINNHNKHVIEQAQSEGRLPNPKELYNPQKLFYLVKTMRQAIEGERVTVDLPNIIVAPVGWQPPELPTAEEQEALRTIEEELASLGVNLGDI
jgi:hypothetical protein